jgi:diacylglycerol kinase family enzyme
MRDRSGGLDRGAVVAIRAAKRRHWTLMRVIVLTNPAAGAKADSVRELRETLERAGVDIVEVRAMHGEELTAAARQAAGEGVDAVIAAGGDGTVSAVAAGLAETSTPLGVLPTGTLNHFARDMNLPPALSAAAKAIAAGAMTTVDVAEVNGRVFINNSSIGLYPRLVGKRDRQRQRLGRGKWIAMFLSAISVFRRFPSVRVRIGTGDQTLLRTTPFVFVGNNAYEISLTTLGQRKCLNSGQLCVYLTRRTGRFALFRLALRAILGRLEQARDFDALCLQEVWIESPRKYLRVALDGEVVRVAPPLHYRIRPAALRVIVDRVVPVVPTEGRPGC